MRHWTDSGADGNTPGTYLYIRDCARDIAWFATRGRNCSRSKPLAAQCTCVKPGGNGRCALWAAAVEPSGIPTGATYGGTGALPNRPGVRAQKWSFFEPALGSVMDAYVAEVVGAALPALVRTVGGRVQIDYEILGTSPPAAAFAPPQGC